VGCDRWRHINDYRACEFNNNVCSTYDDNNYSTYDDNNYSTYDDNNYSTYDNDHPSYDNDNNDSSLECTHLLRHWHKGHRH
jgi:hypothetical protein